MCHSPEVSVPLPPDANARTLRPYADYPQACSSADGRETIGGSLTLMTTSPALAQILRDQSGVVTRQQALCCGLAAAAVDNKLRNQRWQRMHQGVYATFSGVPDRQAQMWAVVLRAGPQAALSFRTAAELCGLAREPSSLLPCGCADAARPARPWREGR